VSRQCSRRLHPQRGTARSGDLVAISGGVLVRQLAPAAGIGLVGSDQYVQLLAIKLALFAAMLGLAAMNRFLLTPALPRVLGAGSEPPGALRAFRRSVAVEVGLPATVLAIVASPGTLMPPASL